MQPQLTAPSTASSTSTSLSNQSARRHLRLGNSGSLLISTDLHGNGEDFRKLESIFLEQRSRDPSTQWIILGDLVHGPDVNTARELPDLYGYWDESTWIVRRLLQLMSAYPQHIHFVLGNHDYAHIGGEHTRKFHDDEVIFLKHQQSLHEQEAMHQLFENAYLAISTPSGLLFTHGAPNQSLDSLAKLDDINLSNPHRTEWERKVIHGLLWAYGQKDEVAQAVLHSCSQELPKSEPLRFIIHGHDRDEKGWFTEGQYQLCIVLFGALRAHKRYLMLDLARVYHHLDELTHPSVMRCLYPTLNQLPDVSSSQLE